MAEDSSNGQFQEDCRSGNKKNANAGVTGKTGLRRHSRPRLMRIAFRIDSGYEDDPRPIMKQCNLNSVFLERSRVDDEIEIRQKERIDFYHTYAPVALITTIRLLLALATIHNLVIHQMDVKTAFLNGDLDEEVYMKQPEGFVMPGNEHKKQTCITGSTMESEFVALAAAGKEAE
ncbi:zinc finger, CCHC-type containing protein [Tanacetum coccineum]